MQCGMHDTNGWPPSSIFKSSQVYTLHLPVYFYWTKHTGPCIAGSKTDWNLLENSYFQIGCVDNRCACYTCILSTCCVVCDPSSFQQYLVGYCLRTGNALSIWSCQIPIFASSGCVPDWLLDCLVDCLTAQLTAWLPHWLLLDCLTAWLLDCLTASRNTTTLYLHSEPVPSHFAITQPHGKYCGIKLYIVRKPLFCYTYNEKRRKKIVLFAI